MFIFVQGQGGRKFSAEKLHCVQPQEYIEYFEDSAKKLHCVQNLSLTPGLGKKGRFAKVSYRNK